MAGWKVFLQKPDLLHSHPNGPHFKQVSGDMIPCGSQDKNQPRCKVSPRSMAMVLTRGKRGEVQRKSPCQDGGKGWRDGAISQGMLRLARERRKGVPELTPHRMLKNWEGVAHFLLSVPVNTSGDPVKPHAAQRDCSYSGTDSGKVHAENRHGLPATPSAQVLMSNCFHTQGSESASRYTSELSREGGDRRP